MLISHGQLYTFTLSVPKATYDTLLPSFERMVRAARFSTPDTGLLPLADGSLMQRDFRFSLRVPAGWKPSFAPSDQVLFFAGAAPTGIWTNNMLVIAGPARALDLDALARRLPGQIEQANPRAKVLQCKPVPQGPSRALETIVEVRQGPFRITVLERRFQAKRMNYEVKYTVRSDDFPALAKELRRSADSFHELPVPAAPKPRVRL